MKKVTRTIPTLIARYKNKRGEDCVTRFSTVDTIMIQALLSQGAEVTEVGYAPLLYSMSEELYMEKAICVTDLSTAKLYPTLKECPTRAERAQNNENE